MAGRPLSNDMENNSDAMACGTLRDYVICAYSELGTPGRLLVKVSRDDGQTWSAPVAVDNVGLADSGVLQRINWVSFAQPADRYLDNTARLFLSYFQGGEAEGKDYKNRIRWVRVQVGPRADFNADEIVDANDLADFETAHAAADWRADFNDDGAVDELDRTAFAAAMADEFPGSSRSVPNVVGMTQAVATTAITNAELLVGTVTQQSSATVPAGRVISQDPIAGTSVGNGSAVNLVVSAGTALVSVPDVVGLTQAAAATAITNAELVVGTVTQQSSATVPAGEVISQNPTAGSNVTVGSAVNLVVSAGTAMVSVPDVVGTTQAAAATAITNADLVVGTVTQQSSAAVPAGSVISQEPIADTSVAVGSVVSLVVSSGSAVPPPASPPSPTPDGGGGGGEGSGLFLLLLALLTAFFRRSSHDYQRSVRRLS